MTNFLEGSAKLAVVSWIGFMIGIATSNDHVKPNSVYIQDLNEDHKQDIVVEIDKKKYAFIQQDNGDYIRYDALADSLNKDIEQKMNEVKIK